MGAQPNQTYPQQRLLARFLIEQLPDPVIVLDRHGAVVDANRAAWETCGFDAVRLFAQDAPERPLVAKLIEDLLANGRAMLELETAGPGEPRSLRLEAAVVETWIVVVVRDRSALRALEEENRQLRGLASTGIVAASVAHDFNNLLTPILTLSSLLARKLDGRFAQHAAEIEAAAARAARLTKSVLALARPRAQALEPIEVGRAVLDLRGLLERLVGSDIELVIEVESLTAQVCAERARLEHALLNLAANARDAMPGGGTLTIAVEELALGKLDDVGVSDSSDDRRSPSLAGARGPSAAGAYVRVAVTDTGTGIPDDVRERMFESFFTTKAAGQGTGLGLASVRRFVDDSGGFLSVHSALDRGTTIALHLPMTSAGAEVVLPSPARGLMSGSESVLIVDAHDPARRAVRYALESCGFEVLEANSARAAFEAVRAAPHVELVLVDAELPQSDLRALREELPRRAGRAFIVLSPRLDDAAWRAWADALGHRVRLLRKPFTSEELLRQVRAVLDETEGEGARGAVN